MLELLRGWDSGTIELPCGKGSLLLVPRLAGRIFCQWAGALTHRLDAVALQNPVAGEYNNLGGNSLWPAPEGGRFAFNYGPESDAWFVQDGISSDMPVVERRGDATARLAKNIQLINRQGVTLNLEYSRELEVLSLPAAASQWDLEGMAYVCIDAFEPLGDYDTSDVLIAPWSLEQFPGAEGIVSFGKLADSNCALNTDFYTDPGTRITRRDGQFTFVLGGKERHQIGVPVVSQPSMIGALDPGRGLLIIRKTPPQDGLYFNIADNDQKSGPFSAADSYSIFNGGELGFFELETIGAMQSEGGRVARSALPSETLMLHGAVTSLLQYLGEVEGVVLEGLL